MPPCLSVVCGELTLSQFGLLWIFFSSTSVYNQPLRGFAQKNWISVLTFPSSHAIIHLVPSDEGRSARIWSHGSVGRAHRSHRWGHRFESCCDHQPEKVLRNQGFFFFSSPLQRVHFTAPTGYISRCERVEQPFRSRESM